MNAIPTIPHKTRSEQVIQHLLSLKRPLEEWEQEELYRALHADYMRKWRAYRAQQQRNAVADKINRATYRAALHDLRPRRKPVDLVDISAEISSDQETRGA